MSAAVQARAARKAARPKPGRSLAIYAALIYLFLHVPLLTLIGFSFNSSRFTLWEGFSFRWYQAVFTDAEMTDAAWNSAIIAIASTAISTIAGTLAAYALWKRRSRLLSGSLYLSLVTPEIVTGVSLLAFFQWAFRFLGWRLGLHTVILAHVSFSIAYVGIVVAARLRTFDPALEEAALDLGSTEWRAFWRVTLPALAPGIIAAALLALTISFDDYVITSLVAGVDSTTLPAFRLTSPQPRKPRPPTPPAARCSRTRSAQTRRSTRRPM